MPSFRELDGRFIIIYIQELNFYAELTFLDIDRAHIIKNFKI